MAGRKSINIAAFHHANPIPNASRIGNIVVSGVILGREGATGAPASTLAQQCALVFGHMKGIIEEAGGTTEDIIKVNVALKDPSNRKELNAQWTAMFPDADARPARHTTKDASDSPYLIQIDFMAVLS